MTSSMIRATFVFAQALYKGDKEMQFRNIALALFSAFSVSMIVALCVLLHYRMF